MTFDTMKPSEIHTTHHEIGCAHGKVLQFFSLFVATYEKNVPKKWLSTFLMTSGFFESDIVLECGMYGGLNKLRNGRDGPSLTIEENPRGKKRLSGE